LSRANGAYTLEVVGYLSNPGDTAVTVAAVVRRDRFMEVESMRAAPGTAARLTSALPDSLIRVIFWVNLPIPIPGGVVGAFVTLGQELGGGTFTADINEDAVFVFDIAP
jgi:hypothetical protein